MTNPFPVTEADLHAYVDGPLAASRAAEIDAYLASRPDEAERVRVYREHNQGLQAFLEPQLEEAVPARLREAALSPGARRGWRAAWAAPRGSLQRVAASCALVFVGVASGWLGRAALEPPAVVARGPSVFQGASLGAASLPRQAAIAHVVYSPDVRHPVEIGADQEDQLVTWLSKRLGANIRPPKLGTLGYELIGGRLLPGTSGPVAQFMYHDVTGQRLTLYVSTENAANKDTAFRFAQEGPVNVFYWIDGKFGYALSAGIDKGELARVAAAVFEQLESR